MKSLIMIVLVAGCGEGLTTDAHPYISVLKRQPEGCFSLVTERAPVASDLGLADPCSYTSPPTLLAGVDLMQVVIDYGRDVPFGSSTRAPSPVLTITVDGAVDNDEFELSHELRSGERAYFVATVRAPSQTSSDMRITAGVNSGFQTTVPEVFTLVSPPVGLSLLDCSSGTDCELQGGVGLTLVKISVPGDISQVVALHAALDGIPQPDPNPPIHTEVVTGHTEHTIGLPTPAAHAGAEWTISAQLGANFPVSANATIREPMLDAQLSCGTACAITRNSTVGLEITAPSAIRTPLALVDTRINGVPQLVGAVVDLEPGSNGIATGLIALTAPSVVGTWQIDVSVMGYAIPSIVKPVQ